MTTIVLNTLKGAVTEYGWSFNSITSTHAGNSTGLYTLGGSSNDGSAIDAEIRTGRTNWGSSGSKQIEDVYFGLIGTGTGKCRVETPSTSYEYDVTVTANGIVRAVPGKGIDECYLGFGYRNLLGADFRLDRIEPMLVQSVQRRAKS